MGNSSSNTSQENEAQSISPNRTPSLDLFEGCIIGQALGDSLGFLVEGEPENQCTEFVHKELNVTTDLSTTDNLQIVKRAVGKGIALGQISDDTQMALAMLRAYQEPQTFIPESYALELASLFASGNVVGCGLATAKAAAKLNRGIPWNKSGLPQGSAGNGTAIRAAPIGLFSFDNEQNLVNWAKQQAFITHQDTRCQAGSVVIAGAVSICLVCHPLPPVSLYLQKLCDLCRESSPEFSEHLQKLMEWVNLPYKKALPKIQKCGLDYNDGSAGVSGFVVSSTLWSLYSFLNNQTNYWECICTAISGGGDTDSTAAMAGALSGSYLGRQQIPTNWAKHLHDKTHTTYEDIITLVHSCYKIKFGVD